jgi:integrase
MEMADLSPVVSDQSATSLSGYAFDPHSRKWRISHDNVIYLSWIDDFLNSSLQSGYLSSLQYYAENYSAAHASNLSDRFRAFAKYTYGKRGLVNRVTADDLINYRSILDREHEWYLAAIKGFLKSWAELGYFGIDEDVPALLDSWKLRGNIKGRAVQTLSLKDGPLSDLEFEAMRQKLIDAFEVGAIGIDDFVLVELFMVTGRRPAQLGDLKARDLVEAKSTDGLSEFILNVPRRKQRGVSWRERFKAFALVPEIGISLKALIDKNRKSFCSNSGIASLKCVDEMPIFPNWGVVEKALKDSSLEEVCSLLKSQQFHLVTNEFRTRLDKIVAILNVPSERTGKRLRIFPTRLRRTLATRAAREGYGELIIAELLDHSDTQSAHVYTENVPEHVDAINEAVARQLAPFAQAFSGMLVDCEGDAVRGDDLSSRVKSRHGSVGTCGHYGFCGALGPIACYTCRQFQPWLDAPHEAVLAVLLSERERIKTITRDSTIAATNDRTIVAVTEVIQRCEERHAQLNRAISRG